MANELDKDIDNDEIEDDNDFPSEQGGKQRRLEAIKPFMFKKGQSGNPGGRPKGKSMKEWTRDYLAAMTEEERVEFLDSLSADKKADLIWRMAEGNPDQKHSGTINVVPDKQSKEKADEALDTFLNNGKDKSDTGQTGSEGAAIPV